MRKYLVVAIVICLVLGLASGVSAFDGKRKGFLLGFGLGPGLTSFTQDVGTFTSDRENKIGIQTDFKIGFGTSEQFQIYYFSKVSWFSLKNVYSDNVIISNGFGGVGVTYFLEPLAPTFYLTGGLGFSTWSAPFESGSSTWVGFGLFAGGGYEFSQHWSAEFNVMYGKPSDSELSIDVSTNALTVKGSINFLAY